MGGIVLHFGPPGTGKTTTLSASIRKAVHHYGDEDCILIASLTNTAAHELAGRDLPVNKRHIGTLHALCYRAMGCPPIIEQYIDEWNRENPDEKIFDHKRSVNPEDDEADDAERMRKGERGDQLRTALDLYKQRMTPYALWDHEVREFHARWTAFKERHDAVDFTDMIEYGLTLQHAPFGVRLGVFDESQDFSKLEWSVVHHWTTMLDYALVAGDDAQCQPPETQVETTTGPVSIADLHSHRHRLLTCERHHGYTILGKRSGGYAFRKTSRPYHGPLYCVHAGAHQSRCTPEHKWIVRWTAKAHTTPHYIVYLMRQGQKFRVGWCQLMRNGAFHPGTRARLEQADALWILTVTTSKTVASIRESYFATRYGLPTVMFTPHGPKSVHYTQDTLDGLFASWAQVVSLEERAKLCLEDRGLLYQHPFWTPHEAYARRGGKWTLETVTCNLIPDLMMVPTYTGTKTVEWQPLSLTQEWYDGVVYSLDVDTHHTYIADRIVTHNCLYEWRGADPASLVYMDPPPIQKRVLPQSYRLPRRIQMYCERWAEEIQIHEPKLYAPRTDPETQQVVEGAVTATEATYTNPTAILPLCEDALKAGRRLMILAACGYQLDPTLQLLRAHGIPFGNRWRLTNGAWNPLLRKQKTNHKADRLAAFLAPTRELRTAWTYNELKLWASLVTAEKVFQRGQKKAIETLPDLNETLPLDLLTTLFQPDALTHALHCDPAWLAAHANSSVKKGLDYPINIACLHPTHLTTRPLITVGTIHSVKGGEADDVIIFPDLSQAGHAEYSAPKTRDSVLRQYYVGLSRARETLYLAQPASWRAVSWIPA